MREHICQRFVPRDATARTFTRKSLFTLLLVVGLFSPCYAWAVDIVYSRSGDRSNAVPLAGATLQGLVYVTMAGAPGSASVDFYMDDPDRSALPSRSDDSKPFDLVGGSRDWADALDLATLLPGPHTVTAVIHNKRRSEIVHATFTVEELEPENLPPTIQDLPSQSVAEGQLLAFTVSASDPDNGPPSLSASNVPQGATVTASSDGSAEFSWTPGYDAAGGYSVTFTATDAEDPTLTGSLEVSISVTDTNRPPSLAAIVPQSVAAGETLDVTVSATDPDGTVPLLSIQNLPAGAMFTDYGSGSGTFVWDVAEADVGDHSVTVTARDAAESALVDSGQMQISVAEALPEPLGPLTVEWDPHPQTVVGFKVFFGPSEESAIVQVSELRVDSGEISASEPSVTYDPETDLGLQPGDPACFRVTAFNDVVESPPSQAACM